jgi:hypothetical protein
MSSLSSRSSSLSLLNCICVDIAPGTKDGISGEEYCNWDLRIGEEGEELDFETANGPDERGGQIGGLSAGVNRTLEGAKASNSLVEQRLRVEWRCSGDERLDSVAGDLLFRYEDVTVEALLLRPLLREKLLESMISKDLDYN